MPASPGFFDRLRESARVRRSLLCVGLDPDPAVLGPGARRALEHSLRVVEATAAHVCCFKPNAAFWEQYGPEGVAALRELRGRIPAGIPVVYDAKRADIPATMRAYARAAFEAMAMDAVTAHAYHGRDSLAELTAYADRGVYVVCRTSNPGATDLQHLDSGGRPLYARVAELAEAVAAGANVGLVAGATAPEEIRRLREITALPLLIPGVGAQGGHLEASVRAAWTGDDASCLIAVSRGVAGASDPAAAVRELNDRIGSVLAKA